MRLTQAAIVAILAFTAAATPIQVRQTEVVKPADYKTTPDKQQPPPPPPPHVPEYPTYDPPKKEDNKKEDKPEKSMI